MEGASKVGMISGVIGVADADDVILIKAASHLHFDHDHRFRGVISQRMSRGKRCVDGLA